MYEGVAGQRNGTAGMGVVCRGKEEEREGRCDVGFIKTDDRPQGVYPVLDLRTLERERHVGTNAVKTAGAACS